MTYRRRVRNKPIDPELLNAVFLRDGGACVYCGDWAGVGDHVVPAIAGGKATIDNIVSSCAACNSAASDWMFRSFEDKKRYVLLRRFGKRSHWEDFRDMVGALKGSSLLYAS